MAAHTILRRWLVEHHQPAVDILPGAMTILTRHPLVGAVQRETGSLMIELPGLPLEIVVTGFTTLAIRHGRKLAGVNILVTTRAGERRTLEDHFVRAERKRGGTVTFLAGGAAVRAGESEAGLGMIKARHLPPCPRVMADFAGRCGRRFGSHRAFPDLGLVRVQVAAGAGEVGELVCLGVVQLRQFPVTIAAGDGEVPAFQGEARLVVAREGEFGGLETVHRVAGIATVPVFPIRELAGMWVTVAV